MLKISLHTCRLATTPIEKKLLEIANFHVESIDINDPKIGVDNAESLRLSMLDLLPDEMMDIVKIDFNNTDGTVRFTYSNDIPLGHLRITDVAISHEKIDREVISEKLKEAGLIWGRHPFIDNWELQTIKQYPHETKGRSRRFYGAVWRNYKTDGPFTTEVFVAKKRGDGVRAQLWGEQPTLEAGMEAVENAMDLTKYFF